MMTTARKDIAIDQDWGNRPGVPMETEPRPMQGAHWTRPERQRPTVTVLRRAGLEELTPVFGTAQPPRGLSGWMRARAYRIPESRPAHWGILLAADRVDAMEGLLADSFTRRPFAGIVALAGLVGWGLGRGISRKRTGKETS